MSGVLTMPSASSTRAIVDHGARPDTRPAEDAPIVALIHAGRHRAAIERTARAYGPRLHRFFARWRPEEAEDAVQELLVRVYEALRRDRFRAHASFSVWLFKIATNLRHDHYRRARRRGELLAFNRGHIGETLHGAGRDAAGWCHLTPHEQRIWINAAVATLDDEDQELLALRYDAGLPWVEVARVMGVRPSTAKLRFTELRRLLAERWAR